MMRIKIIGFAVLMVLSLASFTPEADPVPYDEEGIIARLATMNNGSIKARYDVAV